jgi:ribonuclease Z
MSDVIFLGTGGSLATKERDNTSFLIRHNSELLLVDCPGSIIQKIKKAGFQPLEIKSIFLTHTHPDHIYGLPSFVHSLMIYDCSINLYGSVECLEFCENLLDLFHLREEKIKCRLKFFPLRPEENYSFLTDLKVRCLSVPHHPTSLAYHFHFAEEKTDLVYSGDTPVHLPLFQEAKGVDCLIHDCSAPSRYFRKYPMLASMHTDSQELGLRSQESKIQCLIPCHFFGELDFEIDEIEKEIRQNYRNTLIIPSDFEIITLSRKGMK